MSVAAALPDIREAAKRYYLYCREHADEKYAEGNARIVNAKEKVVGVFIPTTPNPTSGFLVFVPEDSLTKLDMSVADGIKFIVSLGSLSPEYAADVAATVPGSAGSANSGPPACRPPPAAV